MAASAPAPARHDTAMPRWQRALLPAVEGAGPLDADGSLPRTARDWVVDITIFGFALVYGLAAGIQRGHHLALPLRGLSIALAAVAMLSLWVRRRHPLAVGVLTVASAAISGFAVGAAAAGMFTVAIHCRPRRTAQLAALSVVSGVVLAAVDPRNGRYNWAQLSVGLIATVLTVGYGLYVRARRELVLSLHERSRRLETEQSLRVQEARLAERTRIAREMHDVLAHRISLLSVHAGALEFNPGASPEEIQRAAGVVRASARAAQEELRQVIGVLRTDDGAPAVEPPQPSAADLPALLEESRRAGMDVSETIELDLAALEPRAGRTVYRIVQEALTNARKHAPGQQVRLRLGGAPETGVRVEIANRPRVGQRPVVAEAPVASGTGLIGLRERVELDGGRLSQRRTDDGGFVVEATLPWSAR